MTNKKSFMFYVLYFFIFYTSASSFFLPVALAMIEENGLSSAAPIRFNPLDPSHSPYAIDIARVSDISEEASSFIQKIEENGFVVLKNALDPQKIEQAKSLLAATYEHFQKHPAVLTPFDILNLSNSCIREERFKQHNNGTSLFDVLSPEVISLCQAFFDGEANISPCAHTRIVHSIPTPYHQPPIHFHVDSMYHGHDKFGLNFWTPLEDCGDNNKPTLQVCAASLEEIRKRLKFNKKTGFNTEIKESLESGSLEVLQGLPRYYFPMTKGDIVVFSNWALHAGYADNTMTEPRMSMELRYLGPKFNRVTD